MLDAFRQPPTNPGIAPIYGLTHKLENYHAGSITYDSRSVRNIPLQRA